MREKPIRDPHPIGSSWDEMAKRGTEHRYNCLNQIFCSTWREAPASLAGTRPCIPEQFSCRIAPISNNHFAHLSAFISEVIMSAWRWNAMLRKKDKVLVTDEEKTVLILALNELRNKLIAEGKYTDAVDELMLRLAA